MDHGENSPVSPRVEVDSWDMYSLHALHHRSTDTAPGSAAWRVDECFLVAWVQCLVLEQKCPLAGRCIRKNVGSASHPYIVVHDEPRGWIVGWISQAWCCRFKWQDATATQDSILLDRLWEASVCSSHWQLQRFENSEHNQWLTSFLDEDDTTLWRTFRNLKTVWQLLWKYAWLY